jgi:hypothetical protein
MRLNFWFIFFFWVIIVFFLGRSWRLDWNTDYLRLEIEMDNGSEFCEFFIRGYEWINFKLDKSNYWQFNRICDFSKKLSETNNGLY